MSAGEVERWRMAIRHTTGYRYRDTVHSSYNEARLTPLTTDRQLVQEAAVRVSPNATVLRYWDYWSTIVDAFDIHEPHTEMAVTSTSVVETSSPVVTSQHSWEDLRADDVCERMSELLAPTSYAPEIPELAEVASSMSDTGSPTEAVDEAMAWVRSRLEYSTGATNVSTTAADALDLGGGVCQDFAHVGLVLLRAMGIPARYNSGYIHPDRRPAIGETSAGQSHAWIDAWVGEWYPVDPTHAGAVGVRHVVVARGRDYSDVSPLRGIYRGGPAEELQVKVELTRLE